MILQNHVTFIFIYTMSHDLLVVGVKLWSLTGLVQLSCDVIGRRSVKP